MADRGSDPIGQVVDRLPDPVRSFGVRDSILIGAAGMVMGYLLTLALLAFTGETFRVNFESFTYVGFVIYSAHHVPAVGEGVSILALEQARISALKFAGYSIVPMVVSLGAGAVATVRNARRDGAPLDAVLAAVSVAIGYGVVAVIGSLLVRSTTVGGVAVSVDTVQAALYGVAYPLGFGLLAASIIQFARYLTVRVDRSA